MPVGKPLHLRLFIEGEEIPVIAAQVNININGPATASIQVVPLDSAMKMYPRSMVHLFFLDTYLTGPAKSSTPTVQTVQQAAAPQQTVTGKYKLLYAGELVGFSFIQTPQSRALVLQCLDFSSYWDCAHVTAISYGPMGNAFNSDGALYGGQIGTFTDIPGDSAAETITRWIRNKPHTPGLTKVSGLAGGIIYMMEAMGGVPGHCKGINDFFTVAELRCRLLSQICAEENDDTAARVLNSAVFEQWLKNGIQQAGGNVTYRDLMKLLFNYIFYEFVPNPSAKFDDVSQTGVKTSSNLSSVPAVSKIIANLKAIQSSINSDLSASSELASASDFVHFQQDAADIAKLCDTASTSVNAVKPNNTALSQAYDYLRSAVSGLTQFATKKQDITPGQALATTQVQGAFYDAMKYVGRALDALGAGTVTGMGVSYSAQRLRSQIIRPDCWFASPPACNVIFPEMYSQISYDRNYLAETTRLSVAVFNTLVGRDSLFANYILAPQAAFSQAEILAKYKGESTYRVLMDHELHVGILPRMEWIPNTGAVGADTNPSIAKTVKDGRIGWALRASLFHFFKYRFAARQAAIQGRFNPFVVCGFPGAVITRPYIIPGGLDTLAQVKGSSMSNADVLTVIHEFASDPRVNAPSHLVGLIGGVVHNIDQNGGTTGVSLHHVRQHRGVDDEFLGILIATTNGTAKRIVKTVLNLNTLQKAGDQKGINLLTGITPQHVVPKPGLANRVKSVLSQSQTVNMANADGSTTPTPFNTTIAVESDNPTTPASIPDGTQSGNLNTQGRPGLIPSPAGRITLGGKGYYGGVIKDIELFPGTYIDNANVQTTTTTTTSTTTPIFDPTNESKADSDLTPSQQVCLSPTSTTYTSKSTTSTAPALAYSVAAVYEEITLAVDGSLPVEEALRPNWFSPAYSNLKIGSQIYGPFFGCGAVVDGLTVLGTSPATVPDPTVAPVATPPNSSYETVISQLQKDEAAKIDSSLEKALNVLGYLYGQVKTQGLDVDDFVRSYINRSIATKEQILGDDDLFFDTSNAPKATPIQRPDGTTPEIGFHTAAVNWDLVSAGSLTGLVDDLSTNYKRIGEVGAKEPLGTRYDVRLAKRRRVLSYVADLDLGPGFKG